MRILHFADLHIGVENYGKPLPETGWSSRMQDFLDSFDYLVEYALSEGVDAVIFAGDAYKEREPKQTQQREFAKRLRKLSAAEIPTFLLVGNHDLPGAEGRAHTLELYRTLDVPNVYVGDNGWFQANGFTPQVIPTKAGPLQVAFLPWPQVSRLLANDQAAAGQSIAQVHQLIEKKLAALVEAQVAGLDDALPSVLAAHVSLLEFLGQEGSEKWMTVGTSPTLMRSSLHAEHFDYIALGHHHNNRALDYMEAPCWYSGSLQSIDFGDEGKAKGFMVLDVDPAKPRGARVSGSGLPKLVEVPSRRFVTVESRPKEIDPTPEVCRAIEKAEVADAIVRVQVHLSDEQSHLFRLGEARRLLERAHYVVSVSTLRPEDSRTTLPAGVQPDPSSPLDTLELYFKTKGYADGRRERLLSAAKDLMESVSA